MGRLHNGSAAAPLPLSLIAQAIPKLTRHDLEALAERLIDHLDEQEPDPDIELNGDELDGSLAEDDFSPQNAGGLPGPGCPLSDPDMAVDDQGCDDINDDREEEHAAGEFSDPVARAEHRDRVRRQACFARRRRYRVWGGQERVEIVGYEFFREPNIPTRRQLLRRKRGVPRRPRG